MRSVSNNNFIKYLYYIGFTLICVVLYGGYGYWIENKQRNDNIKFTKIYASALNYHELGNNKEALKLLDGIIETEAPIKRLAKLLRAQINKQYSLQNERGFLSALNNIHYFWVNYAQTEYDNINNVELMDYLINELKCHKLIASKDYLGALKLLESPMRLYSSDNSALMNYIRVKNG